MTNEKETPFLLSLLRIGLFWPLYALKCAIDAGKKEQENMRLSFPQALKLQGCILSPFSSA